MNIHDDLNLDLTGVGLHPPVRGPIKKLLKHLSGDDYVLHMDNTSLESFLSCDRIGLWRLIHGRTGYPTAALLYGQAIHAALEVRYREGWDMPKMLSEADEKLKDIPPSSTEWRNREALIRTLDGYRREYPEEDFLVLESNREPIIELAFEDHLGELELNKTMAFSRGLLVEGFSELPNADEPLYIAKLQVVWTGVIDLAVNQAGRNFVLDHKTTSIGGPSYFDSFILAQQFVGYTRTAQKLLGIPFSGAILNAIIGRKPTKTGVSLEFARQPYFYAPWLINEWQDDILTLLADFVDRLSIGHFPKKTLWCTGKYGTCAYLKVCQLAPEQRLELLHSDLYAPLTWNPLVKD